MSLLWRLWIGICVYIRMAKSLSPLHFAFLYYCNQYPGRGACFASKKLVSIFFLLSRVVNNRAVTAWAAFQILFYFLPTNEAKNRTGIELWTTALASIIANRPNIEKRGTPNAGACVYWNKKRLCLLNLCSKHENLWATCDFACGWLQRLSKFKTDEPCSWPTWNEREMRYEASRRVTKLGVMELKWNMACVGYITAT